MRRLICLAALALAAAGCGSHGAHRSAPARTSVWTSPAEPSPPGTGHRWSPADEWQLDQSGR